MIKEAQRNLVGTISSQGEKFLTMLLESNIKNDLRMKQYSKKIEQLNKKEERTDTREQSPDRTPADILNYNEDSTFFGQYRVGEQSPGIKEKKTMRPSSRQAKKKESQIPNEEEQKNDSPQKRATMKRQ